MTRVLACLATALAVGTAAAAGSSPAAPTPIYRCTLADRSVLYTDAPCGGGEALDLHPGEADPRAIERLRTLQREASARYARERAIAEAEAAQSRLMEAQAAYAQPTPPAPDDFVGPYDYFAPYYVTPATPPRHRERPPAVRRRPYVVPVR